MQCRLFWKYSILKNEDEWPVLQKDNVHVGSRLGLVVDTDRSLHLYVDGKDQEKKKGRKKSSGRVN